MPRSYKLHWDKKNKVWSQYIRDHNTGKRVKVLLGKARGKHIDPDAYQAALRKWNAIQESNKGTAAIQKPKPKRSTIPNYRHKDSFVGLFDRYMTYQEEQYRMKMIASGTLLNRKKDVSYFITAFIKNQRDDNTTSKSGGAPKIIRPSLVTNYFRHWLNRIAKGEVSRGFARNRFQSFKHFIRYCSDVNDSIRLPQNLESREYSFRTPRDQRAASRQTIVFTPTELQQIMDAAATHRWGKVVGLWTALALNCAWTTIDLATLRVSHVKQGPHFTSIIKNREKTFVSGQWRLWPQVAEALNLYISQYCTTDDRDELVFRTRRGKPLIDYSEKQDTNGKLHLARVDRSKHQWRYVFATAGVKKAFRYMRKTSASAIEKIAPDHRYTQMHLAHTSTTLAGKVYTSGIAQDGLDQLILDLPQIFGIEEQLDRLPSQWKGMKNVR